MKQFNKIIEFRQTVYAQRLVWAKDAQFELMESPPIRSYPEQVSRQSFAASGLAPTQR